MACFPFAVLAIISMIYFGSSQGYNEIIREKWQKIDTSFSGFVDDIKSRKATETTEAMGYLFRNVSFFLLTFIFLFSLLKINIPLILFQITFYFLTVWMSVHWFVGESKLSISMAREGVKYSLMIFAVPALDTLAGNHNLTIMLSMIIDQPLKFLGTNGIFDISNIWLLAAIISLVVFTSFCIYLILSSIIFFPIFAGSLLLCFIVIRFFSLLDRIAPGVPMKPLMALLGAISILYPMYHSCS